MKPKLIIVNILVILLSSCNKSCKDGVHPTLPPNQFYFLIRHNGDIFPDSILSKIKLFYYDNGVKKDRLSSTSDDTSFVFPAARYAPGLANSGVMCSGYVDGIVKSHTNDLYLAYPDGNIDTLYIEIGNLEYEQGVKDRCYCYYPFTVVKFNGKDAPEVTDLHTDDGKPIFLFEK